MSDIKPNTNIKLPPVNSSDLTPEQERVLSQTEIDRETSLIRLRSEKLRLVKEQLELEKLEDDIQNIRNAKAKSVMSHETVEESLRYDREHKEWIENACTHMKGGSSESLLGGAPSQGNDAGNYAMIDHTLTTGVRFRMCQRCPRTWFPNDPDYKWAMSRPTKNSPSTGCPSPGLVRNRKSTAEGGPRMESEIPHRVRPTPDSPFGPGPQGY